MTWSTRRPPEPRVHAAISSASGRPAWAASRPGCHGGSVQFWPRWLNSSGGAPTLMPGTITSWRAQASAPPGCAPTARSVITPMLMPARLAACCAAASCSAVSHCSHWWNSIRSASFPLSSVTSAEPGSASAAGQRAPVGAVHLGEGAPRRPVVDGPAVTGQERVQFGPAARGQRHRADQLGRGALGGPDRVPVDERRGAAGGPQRRGQRLHPGPVDGAQPLVFGDVLDPQVERADLAAAHRQVGGRADRWLRLGRVQRVDQHEVRAQVAATPGGEVGQVVQVAVAPGRA